MKPPPERIETERLLLRMYEEQDIPYVARADGWLIGGCALLPRIGPGAVEIGYHLGADATGNGYATEMARALADVAFNVCGVGRVELHIDPANVSSIAVARRLGCVESGYDGEQMIFSLVNPASESSTTSA